MSAIQGSGSTLQFHIALISVAMESTMMVIRASMKGVRVAPENGSLVFLVCM
jgi:hypothetical protein